MIFSPKLLFIPISTIQPCMEYFCHVWTCAPGYYLEMADKLQKWILTLENNKALNSFYHKKYF